VSGAPPAVVNAVVDALREFDVRHIDMPLTPEKVWQRHQGMTERRRSGSRTVRRID